MERTHKGGAGILKILIVEEEYELNHFISHALLRESYEVYSVRTVAEGGKILNRIKIDLLISDMTLSEMDGFTFIRQLRTLGVKIPVLMLIEKDNKKDLTTGVEIGVNYYLVKPVKRKELLFHVKRLLRQIKNVEEGRLLFGETELLVDTRTVNDNIGSHILSEQEFLLLYKLLSYPGQIFSYHQLLHEVWKMENDKNICLLQTHIKQLSERFQENKDFEIIDIQDFGYRAVKKHSA